MSLVVACSCGLGALAALARAPRVSSTTQPLPGSQFQGGDGNQDDATGLIDWQGFQADGRVSHTSDPQANDNIFTGGSKELQPDGWGLTTHNGGATPASANVLDTYRAVDQPPGGDVFLYLGFTREASDGTIFVTFELNQDPRTWKNPQGATIPCRTTGDILISFDDHGDAADVEIERWVTDTTDAATGCAKTGHLVSAGLTPNVDVQASFNDASDIADYLPGFYTTSIPQLQFGEAAVNLSTVLSGLGEPCAAFGSTWMHSRSSLSDTADMKDYVVPQPFQVRTCKASPDLSTAASGSVNRKAHRAHRRRRHRTLRATTSLSDTAHLTGGAAPTGTLAFDLYGPDDPGCAGPAAFTSSATVDGNGYYQSSMFTPTRAGTYRWVASYSGDDNNHPVATGCGDDPETVVVSRASPTLTSTASGPARRASRGAARAAQPIHDTADLAGGLAPAGTITFKLYGPHNADCTRTAVFTSTVTVNGNGSYNSKPFTPGRAGTYRWVVRYSGDDNNNPAGPTGCGVASETVTLDPAHPTITTVASGAVVVGQPISDSAMLTGGADPRGRLTFHVYGPDDHTCSGPPAHSSAVSVSGNDTYHSPPFTPAGAGTYRWVVRYSGDRNNSAAGPTACDDPAEAVIVGHPVAQPQIASTASASAPAGSPIHDTAHLSAGSDPTGTITFRAYGPADADCAGPPAATSSVTVSGNGDYTSPPFSPAQAGTYHWIARYSGDDHNHHAGPTACDDPAEAVSVTRAVPALTTLTLAVAPIGAGIRDRAFLGGGSQPGGTVTFRLYGPNDPGCTGAPAFTTSQIVVGNGVYRSSRFAPSHAGTYRWVTTYSGDTNNEAAATRCGDRGEDVVVPPRRLLLTTSASPPANVLRRARRVRAAGLMIYDAATLRVGYAPTGSITFVLYGPQDATCSGTPVFTSVIAVAGNGVYNSERFTPTASGTYRWVAVYSGDRNNRPAGRTPCNVAPERVNVILPSDPELTTSASAAVTLGDAIHDTAHLSDGAAPTGTITFRLYPGADTTCSGRPLFMSTVNVAGNGDYVSGSPVPVAAGIYRWVADYSGDAANHPAGPTACGDSAERALVRDHRVVPVTPAFSTSAGQEPPLGATVYDTAHLAGGVDPGGTVTFSLFGPDGARCSGAPAFTATVAIDGNGAYRSPSFVVARPGTYRWVAAYSGDALNSAAGPGTCGEPAETSSVSPAPAPEAGPNVPAPPKPRVKPQHRAIPPPPAPPPPAVTG